MQDVIGEAAGRGAAAGHQELASTVRRNLVCLEMIFLMRRNWVLTHRVKEKVILSGMDTARISEHNCTSVLRRSTSFPLMILLLLFNSDSSDCLLSDAESSSSDSPVADKRAPGSERAAERAAQQNERERIRLVPGTSLANIQVHTHTHKTHTYSRHRKKICGFGGIYNSLRGKKRSAVFSGV